MQDFSNIVEVMNLYSTEDVNSYLKGNWILLFIHTKCEEPEKVPGDQQIVFTIGRIDS
jgi:hypothetical protein